MSYEFAYIYVSTDEEPNLVIAYIYISQSHQQLNMITILITSILTAITTNIVLATSPISIGLIILIIALLLATFYATTLSSWVALLIFLLYVGGMLVIFSYFVALSPNQQLFGNTYITILVSLTIIVILIFTNTITPINKIFHPITLTLYLHNNAAMLLILASLLLFAIIIVVKVSIQSKGPLRSFIA